MSRKRPPSDIDEDDNLSVASSSLSFDHHHHHKLLHSDMKTNNDLPSDDETIFVMDDCAAALLLMNLSCSPKSPNVLVNRITEKRNPDEGVIRGEIKACSFDRSFLTNAFMQQPNIHHLVEAVLEILPK